MASRSAFGRHLENCLRTQAMSARAFAARVGVQAAFINKVMQGDRTVPLKRVEAWADALKLKGTERERFLEAAYLTHCPPFIQDVVRKLRAGG